MKRTLLALALMCAFIVGAKFGPTPAEPTKDNPRRRPSMLPGTFEVMVVERQ